MARLQAVPFFLGLRAIKQLLNNFIVGFRIFLPTVSWDRRNQPHIEPLHFYGKFRFARFLRRVASSLREVLHQPLFHTLVVFLRSFRYMISNFAHLCSILNWSFDFSCFETGGYSCCSTLVANYFDFLGKENVPRSSRKLVGKSIISNCYTNPPCRTQN